MIKTEHTAVTELHITALPEAKLGHCMREAVLVACSEWQNVPLTYQDREYRMLCNDLLSCVVGPGDKTSGVRDAGWSKELFRRIAWSC